MQIALPIYNANLSSVNLVPYASCKPSWAANSPSVPF